MPYTAFFLATQNGGVVSGFPSTVRFTFAYVRYCIRSIATHQLKKYPDEKPGEVKLLSKLPGCTRGGMPHERPEAANEGGRNLTQRK